MRNSSLVEWSCAEDVPGLKRDTEAKDCLSSTLFLEPSRTQMPREVICRMLNAMFNVAMKIAGMLRTIANRVTVTIAYERQEGSSRALPRMKSYRPALPGGRGVCAPVRKHSNRGGFCKGIGGKRVPSGDSGFSR